MAQSKLSGILPVTGGGGDSITGQLLILIFLELMALGGLRYFSRHHHGG